MTSRWLPDAEFDPHPRLTWLLEVCCDLVISRLYRIKALYPSGYRLDPGTLVVSNHRRDVDVPILASVLCQREGLRLRQPLPFFAGREDLFRRDFLGEYLHAWPRPLQRALGRLPVTWFFRTLRVRPIRRVREFSLSEAFSELASTGNRARWLNQRGRHEMTTNHCDDPDSRGKPPERRAWGLRRLRGEAREAIEPAFRATVATQLQHFVSLLDAGRSVYLAPEGRNSRDGRFGRIRAGAWHLAQRATTRPPILPIALSYDALRAGRLRAIVHVGTPLTGYSVDTRGGFDTMLETQIRKLYLLNPSHLASRFLLAGPTEFSSDDFAHWMVGARNQLVAAGLGLAPTLVQADITVLAAERLAWLDRAGLVTRTASGWHNICPRDARPSWRTLAGTVRYCDNALADHLAALTPGLTLQP